MPEQQQVEAKEDFDVKADAFLDKGQSDSSADKEQVSEEPDSGAEPAKTEQVRETENDKSLSVEQKMAKIKEILGDDEKAIEAYIKQKGYHNDPAWQKQRELIEKSKQERATALSQEDREALEEFKQYRQTAEYVKSSMKEQGYTPEAINRRLQEMGHDVEMKPQDDVNMVVSKLGINLDQMQPTDKAAVLSNISDIAKIADILITDRMSKVLPKELAPIQDTLGTIEKTENASTLVSNMEQMTQSEGVLDFTKDVEPELHKFLDANPDASQQDVFEHFKNVSRQLSIERLKTGKKKEERDEKKSNLRQNVPMAGINRAQLPKRTGNFDKDADTFLDSFST